MIENPGLFLAKPCAEGTPLFCSVDVPARLRRIVTHPLEFRRIHGTDKLPRHEARRMTPIHPKRRMRNALLGMGFMKHYDLVSGRVGCPRSDSFLLTEGGLGYGPNKSIAYVCAPGQEGENGLCADTGLSLTALRRAIADYRLWGWVTSTQRVVEYRNAAGEACYYACRVVYVLTEQFFVDLRIDRKWRKVRAAASRRLGHRPRRIYPLEAQRPSRAHRHHLEAGDNPARPHGRGRRQLQAERAAAIEASENDRRAEIARQMELRRLHPDWPAERIRAEAKHQT